MVLQVLDYHRMNLCVRVWGTLNRPACLLCLVNPHPTHPVESSTTPTYGCCPCRCLIRHQIIVGPLILPPSREALRVSFCIWLRGLTRRTSQGSQPWLTVTAFPDCQLSIQLSPACSWLPTSLFLVVTGASSCSRTWNTEGAMHTSQVISWVSPVACGFGPKLSTTSGRWASGLGC